MDLFVCMVIWLLFAHAAGAIGSKKGIGFLGFMHGLLFGPFGVLWTIFTDGNRQTCPYCKSLVHKDATVCPYCRRGSSPES